MNRFKGYFFILILPIIHLSVFGQTENEIDSLEKIQLEVKDINEKLDALGKLIEIYSYNNPDRASKLLKETLAQIRTEENPRAAYRIFYEYANYYNVNAKFDSAIIFAKKSLDMVEIIQDSTLYSVPNLHLAWSYSILGDYESARKATLQTLVISEKMGDWSSLAESYFGVGNLYFYESNLPLALEAYLKTDSILQQHDPYNMTLVNTNINIAQVLIIDKQYEKAPYYLDKSEKVADHNDHGFSLASVNLVRGILHTKAENFEAAFPYLKKAEEFFETFHSDYDLGETYYFLGQYYYNTKSLKLAKSYHNKSVILHQKVEDPMGVANSYFTLGRINGDEGRYTEAIKFIEQAHQLYDESSIEQKTECLSILSDLYAKTNSYGKAYQIAKEYNQLRDTLLKRQNSEVLNDLETKYQTEKKEQEIALLSSQNDLINQQKTNQRNLLLGGIGISTVAGVFLFFLYRNRLKTNKKLRELDTLKSNFFANISHEFRTPLTLISGPLEKRLAEEKTSDPDRREFEMMQRNSVRLLGLVDQLLDLSKLEAGKYNIRISSGDLGTLLRALAESFKFSAEQSNIEYIIEIGDIKDAWFDKEIIEKVLTNLLSNAFKYTAENGEIRLIAKTYNGHLELDVQNSPSSVSPELILNMFERFYQGDAHAEGAGVGLSLVKELIHLSKGKILVSQPAGDTLSFQISLPIEKSYFSSDEIDMAAAPSLSTYPSYKKEHSTQGLDTTTSTEIDDEQEIILVVEDNDDVRQLIRNHFKENYRIIDSKNGEEGIQAALEWIPDLIISDIMMPKVDGLELTNRLKNDERTSHIPVILLTAKAGEEDQYEGLGTGADAYITKPFKMKLLETRVNKLIESRKLLRDRYSQEVILKPKDIAITNIDEQFLERIQQVMDDKLTESSFSVQDFSKAVGMSRMQLHRKLKALTGLSASEFVRSQRLKLAANLLQTSNANVSEIGYQVGFNDPSYFTKCFKEAYAVSPTDYSKKHL